MTAGDRQCPGCDPITRAGCIRCGHCQAESWPVDAEWAGDFILAAYQAVHEPGCPERRRYGTVLLDVDGDDKTVPKVQRPPRPGTNRCTATTRAGDRCRNKPREPGGLCASHLQCKDS